MHLSRKLWAFVILIPILLSGCELSLAQDITPPPNYVPPTPVPEQPALVSTTFPIVPPDPAAGAAIYAEKCLPCHGATGMGDGPQASELPNPAAPIGSPDFARQAKPIDWFQIVTTGNFERYMPGFSGSLNDRQRWDVVAYTFTLSTTESELAQGKEAYSANCAACHGEQGRGDGPEAANLPGTPASWNDQSRLAQLSAENMVGVMNGQLSGHPSFTDQVDATTQYAIAAYVRSLSFSQPGQAPVESASGSSTDGTDASSPATSDSPTTGNSSSDSSMTSITVNGQVTNSTPGGSIPGGLEAVLTAYEGMTPAFETSVPVSADGSFTFEDVVFNPEYVYFAQVLANGLTFTSDILHGADISAAEVTLPVEIYETTTDQSQLRVDRLHIFFDFTQPGMVQVVNLFIISNLGDKVVVPEQADDPVVRFTLPEGAANLAFQDGELGGRYVETDNGFGDRMSVVPGVGQNQIVFGYELPYDRKQTVEITSPLPVDAAVVMLPPMGVKLKSDQLTDAGERNVQGMSFKMYQASSGLAAGEPLKVSLSGNASADASATQNETLYLALGGGAFVLALAGAGLWFYRQRRGGEVEEEEEPEEEHTFESSEAVLDAIVALDDLHANGTLPEDAYQERRAELKARLADALEREKGS